MRFCRTFLAAVFLSASGGIHAAPVSFKIDGYTTFNQVATGGYFTEMAEGSKFSATITIETDNAKIKYPSYLESTSGCKILSNGLCQLEFGNWASIITAASLTVDGKTTTLKPAPGYRSTAASAQDTGLRLEVVQSYTTWDDSSKVRLLQYQEFIFSATGFPGVSSTGAFYSPPNLDNVDLYENAHFVFSDYTHSCEANGIDQDIYYCQTQDSYTGQQVLGRITSWTLADANEVPEPASVALIGIGLVGLSAFRRRYSK